MGHSYHLSDLMRPSQRKDVPLLAKFDQYRFLLECVKEAIASWKGRQFERFDALVGENACQIRAIYIAILAKKGLRGLTELEASIDLAERKITQIKIESHDKKHFEDILKADKELQVELSEAHYFLILSYILSVAKRNLPKEQITKADYANSGALLKLMPRGAITPRFAKHAVNFSRNELAKVSVKFIREQKDGFRWDEELATLVSDKYVHTTTDKKKVVSFFASLQIVSSLQLKYKIPYILSVQQRFINGEGDRLNFLLNPDHTERDVLKDPLSENELEEAAIVVEGVTVIHDEHMLVESIKKRVLEIPLHRLIAANGAAHRQSPDGVLDITLKNGRFSTLKQNQFYAKEWGCSLENPSRFVINHIFVSSIKSKMHELLKTYALGLPTVEHNKSILYPEFALFKNVPLKQVREKKGDINEIRILLKGNFQLCYHLFRQAVLEEDVISQIQLSHALFGMKWGKDHEKDFSFLTASDLEEFRYYPKQFMLFNMAYDAAFDQDSEYKEKETRGLKIFNKAAAQGYLPAVLELNDFKWHFSNQTIGYAARLRPYVGKGDKYLDYEFGKALKSGSHIGSELYYEGLYWMNHSCGILVKYPLKNQPYEKFIDEYIRFKNVSSTFYDHDGFRHIGDSLILVPSLKIWESFVNKKLNIVKIAPLEEYYFNFDANQIKSLLIENKISFLHTNSFVESPKGFEFKRPYNISIYGFRIDTLCIYQDHKPIGEISIREDTSKLYRTEKHPKIQPVIDFIESVMTRTGSANSAYYWLRQLKDSRYI